MSGLRTSTQGTDVFGGRIEHDVAYPPPPDFLVGLEGFETYLNRVRQSSSTTLCITSRKGHRITW